MPDCIGFLFGMYILAFFIKWSEWQDSNLRPSGPKPDALPGCATLRRLYYYSTYEKFKSIKISKIREILKEYDIKKNDYTMC